MTLVPHDPSLEQTMLALGSRARAAARILALAPPDQKNTALRHAATALRADAANILAANARDLEAARHKNLKGAFVDRLILDPARLEAMAAGLEALIALPDPVGCIIKSWTRADGLAFEQVRVPIGVIGIIYESRPNVTIDAGALCLKSGNAAILRGGSDSHHTSHALAMALARGIAAAGLPEDAVQMVPVADRAAVGMMLEGLGSNVDVIVPRGGKSLVARVQAEARVPVFSHLEGLCHVYVDREADPQKALAVVLNSKMRRTGVCGAAETVLVDGTWGELARLIAALVEAGCEVRGDAAAQATNPAVVPVTEEDWRTEYNDAIIALRVVSGVEEAMAHIARYGSNHTDSIVTENPQTAARFLNGVDSAIVLHNASTQFADGGEFGFGAEIGIATGRLHARGPVGLEQLTTFKYKVRGNGHTRP